MNTSGPQGWKTSASECEYFKISDDISSDNEKELSESDNDIETESESSSGYNSGKEW